ncbi:helix-turn-helix domain-containing protein [Nocardia terpenica]|nr:helix-turn-helix transcriptional regulator [Nocardia terpenica]NQE91081.1 helix-turn-helix transcriptional regulator [Nocardia terpenica]
MQTKTVVYGRMLEERRAARGLSQRKAAEMIGLSHTSLRNIESGESVPRKRTCSKLDDMYGYLDGSVYNMYRYDQAPIERETPAPPPAPRLPTGEFPVLFPLQSMLELLEADGELGKLATGSGDERMLVLRQKIGRSVDRLLRAWVTAQVEGMRTAGHDDQFIKTLLAVHLARTPLADDPQDQDELTYLRWLLGYAGELSQEQQARYADLFATRTKGHADAVTRDETEQALRITSPA